MGMFACCSRPSECIPDLVGGKAEGGRVSAVSRNGLDGV